MSPRVALSPRVSLSPRVALSPRIALSPHEREEAAGEDEVGLLNAGTAEPRGGQVLIVVDAVAKTEAVSAEALEESAEKKGGGRMRCGTSELVSWLVVGTLDGWLGARRVR